MTKVEDLKAETLHWKRQTMDLLRQERKLGLEELLAVRNIMREYLHCFQEILKLRISSREILTFALELDELPKERKVLMLPVGKKPMPRKLK